MSTVTGPQLMRWGRANEYEAIQKLGVRAALAKARLIHRWYHIIPADHEAIARWDAYVNETTDERLARYAREWDVERDRRFEAEVAAELADWAAYHDERAEQDALRRGEG